MKRLTKTCFLFLFCLTITISAGCNSDSKPTADGSNAGAAGGGHDHDHASEGPHGGHILELGNEEYHLEWLHNESGKLTFYLLDAKVKEDVSTTASSISITATVKDESTTTTLNSATPDAAEHNRFEIIDPVLLQRLELVGHGVTAKASVQIGDKEFIGEFEHHDHGHGHSH